MESTSHYRQPDWFTRNIFNRLVKVFTRLGLSVRGSRVLEVPGRKSGLPRQVPVNLLHYSGAEYLVAPRGETEWVRNVRAAQGQLTLIKGRKREPFAAIELNDEAKPDLLRAYLAKWKFEVGMFFDGVGPDSSDAEVAAIADRHPVFLLKPATAS